MTKVLLIVGHKAVSGGAVNATHGVSEYDFNYALAHDYLADAIVRCSLDVAILHRDGISYKTLIRKANEIDPALVVSLHCNAFDTTVSGSEVLHYRDSPQGAALAGRIQRRVVGCLGLDDRGLRPCDYGHVGRANDRGGYLLRYTRAPAAIVEPFFIDNDSDYEHAAAHVDELAVAISEGIADYVYNKTRAGL